MPASPYTPIAIKTAPITIFVAREFAGSVHQIRAPQTIAMSSSTHNGSLRGCVLNTRRAGEKVNAATVRIARALIGCSNRARMPAVTTIRGTHAAYVATFNNNALAGAMPKICIHAASVRRYIGEGDESDIEVRPCTTALEATS